MKKQLLIIFLIIVGNHLFAQTNFQKFKSQSPPIKKWIIFHPFKAKKAELVSKKAIIISDSIATTNLLDSDKYGGQVDAFRHAFWMATLSQKIGKCAAQSLGRAYERSNKRTYRLNKRKGKTTLYDKPSKRMDLFNNKVGIHLSKRNEPIDKKQLINNIVSAIKKGKFKILKKDVHGNFLNCEGKPLNPIQLQGWRNEKCLVPSGK